MDTNIKVSGFIEIYRVSDRGRELVLAKRQTINSSIYTALTQKLAGFDTAAGRGIGVDGITWGSWNDTVKYFVDGTYAGTFAAGTGGALIRSYPSSQSVKFSGTFGFAVQKTMNYFELGQQFNTPGAGITQLCNTRYAYDNSILTGSSVLTYNIGENLIVNWTISFA
jgi:hypothetical protein